MKFRKPLALMTAQFLTTSSSLSALAANWDLGQQGSLHINTSIDYTVTSTDRSNSNITTTSKDDKAAIHVSNGNLTITSQNNGTLTVENDANYSEDDEYSELNNSAAIGSVDNSLMTASIIGGNPKVTVSASGTAAITTNVLGDFAVIAK